MDIFADLPIGIDIYNDDGELFKQEITYKCLPNTCFHCDDKYHYVKNYPIKFSLAPKPTSIKTRDND